MYNRFGGSGGGPLRRDRTFLFAAVEWLYDEFPEPGPQTVPTEAMRNGDFSALLGQGITIYDPATARIEGGFVTRSAFPGNIIPQNRISPIAKKFLNFPIYAEPTVAGRWTTNNFEKNASVGGDNNQVNVRADYNMS